jgi:ubiquinol-cytochrome c reductase cytochrome c1 subunit
MKKFVITLLVALFPLSDISASVQGGPKMESMEVRLSDYGSLQNGAKLFVNYCLGCHSAQYMRYNRMAEDIQIPLDLVKDNMVFPDVKVGDPMISTMSREKAEEWFGVAPPDLSLAGRLRGATWLYNYFKGFYVDETTVSGWNNIVFENVAMPHALADLQGRQRAIYRDDHGVKVFDHFELESEGSMSPEEFDHAMRDLTNFMAYMGEPAKLKRVKYGIFVMLFLLVFGVFAYMLKKEYWRDVDTSH